MKSKEAFTKDPIIFTTNNYSLNTNVKTSPNPLKLSVPRFPKGEGSFIQLNTSLNNKANAKQAGLLIYTTYDEGSKILYPSHAHQDPRLLPTLLVLAAIASFVGPYVYQLKIKRRRDFATRILFDFLHIHRRLVNNPDDKELLVMDDMAGRKRWKKYDDYTKRGLLKIDHKFFYLYDSFTELKGKDPKDGKYDYYTLIHEGYKAIDRRDKQLNNPMANMTSENNIVKKECEKITTGIRWDVYGI